MKNWQHHLIWLPMAACVAPAYAADYLTAEQALRLLFPDADSYLAQTVTLDDAQRDQIKALSGVRQRWKNQKVWRAEKGGVLLGWMVQDEVIGKHEYITYVAALSADGVVLGLEILSYRETHGGAVREASWRQQLKGKRLQDPFKLDVDVPNISGATLSCRNLTDGVKRLLALQQVALKAS